MVEGGRDFHLCPLPTTVYPLPSSFYLLPSTFYPLPFFGGTDESVERHQDPRQSQGRVRRRKPGEPPLPVLRQQGGRRGAERRRRPLPLHGRGRDGPCPRPSGLSLASGRSRDGSSDRQLAPE